MANEITLQIALVAAKNNVTFQQSLSKISTMSGDEMRQGVQIVGTSAETIDFGDAASPGYILLKNLDATNYVHLYAVSGETPFAILYPGDLTLFRTSEQTMLARANTAACKLFVFVIEG